MNLRSKYNFVLLLKFIFISSFIIACSEKNDTNQSAPINNSSVQLVDNKTKEQIEKEAKALNELRKYEAERENKLNNSQNQDSSIVSNDINSVSQPLNLKYFKTQLAECSGNYLLLIASIKSQILTLGSDSNNEKGIKANAAMNLVYSEIGKSINGDDYERIAQEFYDFKIENFRNQKVSLGVSQAKQNIINDMIAKSTTCSNLLQDPNNAAYAASALGVEKMKAVEQFIQQQKLEK